MSFSLPNARILPVILSGGIGERLWPVSTPDHPKPFHTFGQERTLFEETLKRVEDQSLFFPPLVIAQERHRLSLMQALEHWHGPAPSLIFEPYGRNTAPAILLASFFASETYGSIPVLILPSDHLISPQDVFLKTIQTAHKAAQEDVLVMFGIVPTSPETGYGYIKKGAPFLQKSHETVFHITHFLEKPPIDVAEACLTSQHYLWNSGMFLFLTQTFLDEAQKNVPLLFDKVSSAFSSAQKSGDALYISDNSWRDVPKISIDYALMEKTKRAVVVESHFSWNDLGSWESLWKSSPKDPHQNVKTGNVTCKDTEECYLYSAPDTQTAVLGLKGVIVINTGKKVLVLPKERAQEIKTLLEQDHGFY